MSTTSSCGTSSEHQPDGWPEGERFGRACPLITGLFLNRDPRLFGAPFLRYTGQIQGDRAIKLLGIDVGTGGTRALLIDESGAVIASAIHEHEPLLLRGAGGRSRIRRTGGRPARAPCASCCGRAIPASEIACIGLSGQMHGAVLLDRATMRFCGLRSSGAISARRRSAAISTTPSARSAWWS
jgi:hypothetical protein